MNFFVENDDRVIDIEPKKRDIKSILTWLKDEKRRLGTSFYSDKVVIEDAFKEGKSIVFKYGKKNVGITIWHEIDKLQVAIDIFVINPMHRKQGVGRFFCNEILNYFKTKGFKVVKLFCAPPTSEMFWKKMGFIKFPDCRYTEHKLTYYKVLVNTASKDPINNADKIELWDVDPYQSEEKEPKWSWYVEMKDGVLLYPIIQPCNCDWNLRWSNNGKTYKEDKVKYFTNKDEIYSNSFLYIYKLIK